MLFCVLARGEQRARMSKPMRGFLRENVQDLSCQGNLVLVAQRLESFSAKLARRLGGWRAWWERIQIYFTCRKLCVIRYTGLRVTRGKAWAT